MGKFVVLYLAKTIADDSERVFGSKLMHNYVCIRK